MRKIFLSTDFIWDNMDSSELGLVIATMESDILNNYGFSYSSELESDNSFTSNPFYKETKTTPETINLKFFLVDSCNQAMVWDDYKIEEICNKFTTKDFKPFISYDDLESVYYLKTTKINKVFNASKQGYIDVTFQPYTQYAYKTQVKTITVKDAREVTMVNFSNVEEYYNPILEVKNLGDEATVNTIQNLSIQNTIPMEIKNLKKDEKLIIDNLYYTVLNTEGINKFSNQNRMWIRLKQGANKLKFTGNCVVTVKSQYPIKK